MRVAARTSSYTVSRFILGVVNNTVSHVDRVSSLSSFGKPRLRRSSPYTKAVCPC